MLLKLFSYGDVDLASDGLDTVQTWRIIRTVSLMGEHCVCKGAKCRWVGEKVISAI